VNKVKFIEDEFINCISNGGNGGAIYIGNDVSDIIFYIGSFEGCGVGEFTFISLFIYLFIYLLYFIFIFNVNISGNKGNDIYSANSLTVNTFRPDSNTNNFYEVCSDCTGTNCFVTGSETNLGGMCLCVYVFLYIYVYVFMYMCVYICIYGKEIQYIHNT
jgi:hypothetical protein